jgi:hypothetical protein
MALRSENSHLSILSLLWMLRMWDDEEREENNTAEEVEDGAVVIYGYPMYRALL